MIPEADADVGSSSPRQKVSGGVLTGDMVDDYIRPTNEVGAAFERLEVLSLLVSNAG
jgi:hypothetical protein